jgi:hypothetical protein
LARIFYTNIDRTSSAIRAGTFTVWRTGENMKCTLIAIAVLFSLAAAPATLPTSRPTDSDADLRRIIRALQDQIAALRRENAALKEQLAAAPKPATAPAAAGSNQLSGPMSPEVESALAEMAPTYAGNDGPGTYHARFRGINDSLYETDVEAKSFADAVRKLMNMKMPLRPRYDENGQSHYDGITKAAPGGKPKR